MKKLTQKTFLVLLGLSLAISVLAYICILIFLPYANQNRAKQELCLQSEQLISELRVATKVESEELFVDFIRETGADLRLLDEDRQVVSLFTFEKTEAEIFEGEEHPFRLADSEEEYLLIIRYNEARSEEIAEAMLRSIPFVAVITIVLSVLGAWIFSRYTTRPILRIQHIAQRIADLDFSWYCPDVRDDEIGMLSKSINELSDRLHEALDELYLRNSSLEDEITLEKERERRRMLFFSGVSHELKTPIAIVIGQLEGMQAEIGVYKDREKYLARSAEILQSLNAFIKEVLLVSHIDMSEQREASAVNLSILLQELAGEYSVYAEDSAIDVTEDLADDVHVYGDEMLLKKALGNIISNAVTHSDVQGRVEVKLARGNGTVQLTVTNFPAHIEEEHLPHLFEAFYRVNQSAKHGSGLGLYITRMILETYHISHRIENIEDGVRFTVEFEEASV
ncbi:MAG: HAMP domain-containing histidine kinase [Lachnospiraceae bacterium]|nr:HAMP domain-containing histidine kinase [Lachnospiraceae bacterium]